MVEEKVFLEEQLEKVNEELENTKILVSTDTKEFVRQNAKLKSDGLGRRWHEAVALQRVNVMKKRVKAAEIEVEKTHSQVMLDAFSTVLSNVRQSQLYSAM